MSSRTILTVPASGWFNTQLDDTERLTLIKAGIMPVNDIFLPVFDSTSKIHDLSGGWGSGKSDVVAAAFFALKARREGYFKGFFGRKVKDEVRKSCHSKIVTVIERLGLEDEYIYSKTATGTLSIVHKATKNEMWDFGAENADQMKSVDDPTDIWMEEADQFAMKDFGVLLSRLRTPRAKHNLILTYNRPSVYPGHWILQTLYPELLNERERLDGNDELINAIAKAGIQRIFCNYTDNYFIDQDAYLNDIIIASGGSRMLIEGYARGAWGCIDNKNPWLYSFDYDKHTVPELPFMPTYPVYISFDFNNEPFECTCWQFSPSKGTPNSFIHCIKEFSGNYKIEEICRLIKAAFPHSILFVTGDRSGQNEDLGRNQTLYQLIAGHLNLSKKNLNLNTINLEHADSHLFLNAMYFNYPNIKYSRKECPQTIRQIQIAQSDPDGKKPYQLLKDRGMFKLDAFDSMRYFFQTYFHQFAKDTYFKILGKRK